MKLRHMITTLLFSIAAINSGYAGQEEPLAIDHKTTALLITDPQNDFLHEKGAAYGLIKDNLKKLNTIQHIGQLFKTAKETGMAVFVSPHMYFPHDDEWENRGALQQTMNDIDMFHVSAPLQAKAFKGSGADFYAPYKKYILDGKTVITSPHKVYGPESNDLVLQLRKRGIQTVLLGGMAANLCTDSHMRELIEQGFKVIMIKDAVGAPGEAAYQAALTNYSMIANGVITTEQAVQLMKS